MNSTYIIKSPLITEKSLKEASLGRFTFLVDRAANKYQIKTAVETAFKVNVQSVHTAVIPGRTYRVGKRRQEINASSIKKATVQLAKGQKIDLFDTKS